MNQEKQAVDVLGHQIPCVQDEDGNQYVPLKRICDILGIDHNWQRVKADKNPRFRGKVLPAPGVRGNSRLMYCIPSEAIYPWLFRVDSRTVRPEIKPRLLDHHDECGEILIHRLMYGIAINPRGDAEEIEKRIRESLDRNMVYTPEHLRNPILRRRDLLLLELNMFGKFENEPPRYRDKARECSEIAIAKHLQWLKNWGQGSGRVAC